MKAPTAPWRWALAGALVGALSVALLNAPARWLAAGLARASGERVQLVEPEGSVWRGSARLLLTGGAGSHDRSALPGRLHWRLSPGWGGVAIGLNADCCTPHGPLALTLAPRWGGARLRVADGRSLWPAALLDGLGTPFNTLQPRGELALATRGLDVQWLAGRLQLAGRAELTARHVSSRLSTLHPLGSYQAVLDGGESLTLALSTLEGSALQLSGSGQWVGPRLRFRGEASAAPGLEATLANLLNVLGRRQGDRALIAFG